MNILADASSATNTNFPVKNLDREIQALTLPSLMRHNLPTKLTGLKPYKIYIGDPSKLPKSKIKWVLVNTLADFKDVIKERGVPRFVGFDGDSDVSAKCAVWLIGYCRENEFSFSHWAFTGKNSVQLRGKLLREFIEQHDPDAFEE